MCLAPGQGYIMSCHASSKYSALNILLHVARLDVFMCYSRVRCSNWLAIKWAKVWSRQHGLHLNFKLLKLEEVKLTCVNVCGMVFMCTVLTFKYVVNARVCPVSRQYTANICCLDVWRVDRWALKIITVFQNDHSVSTLIGLRKKGAFILVDLSHTTPCYVTVIPWWKEMACGNNVTLGGKEEQDYSDDKNVISDMEMGS